MITKKRVVSHPLFRLGFLVNSELIIVLVPARFALLRGLFDVIDPEVETIRAFLSLCLVDSVDHLFQAISPDLIGGGCCRTRAISDLHDT